MNRTVKNLFLCLSVLVAILLVASSVQAQKNDPPSGQPAIGVYTTTIFGALPGIDLTYAVNPNVQAGALVGLRSTSSNGMSSTSFMVAPFVRYLFNGSISPFVEAGLPISGSGNGGSSTTQLYLGAGVAYFVNHQLGLHLAVEPVLINFSPSSTTFGFSSLITGADVYF